MRMGRLFWKFFLAFCLAQWITSVGVGTVIWLSHPMRGMHPPGPQAPWGAGPGPGEGPAGPDGHGGPGGLQPPWRQPPGGPAGRGPDPGPGPGRGLALPLMPLLAGSVVSLVFAGLLAHYFSRPIRQLRQGFDALADGQLGTRVAGAIGRRHDELAELGLDFDRMAARLQTLMGHQQRLLHDVSHELRSPLARLQAAADLMQQQPERSAEFSERVQRDTARMDALVGELLTLSRLDAGASAEAIETLDLREVIRAMTEDAEIEAQAGDCHLVLELPVPMPLQGRHEQLHRALENVLRNAIKHSPKGGTVTISAHQAPGQWRISVADEGPGVFAGDLDRIFDPFFRSGSNPVPEGYGLGLAITRKVIESHGGQVSASNRPSGGLVVHLNLPAQR